MKGQGTGGFSLIEVMLAMVILAFSVVGVMGMYQWAEQGLRHGTTGSRALALAESRLEAKRSAAWEALLQDDLNADGTAEITMNDDGEGADERAGDGIYTASVDEGGIHLKWTVQPDRPVSLAEAGSVVILAQASYSASQDRHREILVGTLRANPRYWGHR